MTVLWASFLHPKYGIHVNLLFIVSLLWLLLCLLFVHKLFWCYFRFSFFFVSSLAFQWIWLQCLWQNKEKIAASDGSSEWRARCIQFSISSWTGKWNIVRWNTEEYTVHSMARILKYEYMWTHHYTMGFPIVSSSFCRW